MTTRRRRCLQWLGAGSIGWVGGLTLAQAAPDTCATGRHQSPINITHPEPAAHPAPLRFDYPPAPLRLVHDGHTIRVRLPAGQSRMWVGEAPHALQQFHFHLPAGDQVQGEEFPLGLHFPHKARSGQLVTLVLLFRLGTEHPALAALLPHLPAAGEPEHSVPGVQVNPAAWLPARKAYYAYEGSLTSAPCTEGVRWLVLQQVQTVSAAQLARLRERIGGSNARPVQPLNGRRVVAHD